MKNTIYFVANALYYPSVFMLVLLGLDHAAKLLNISGSIVQLIVGAILLFVHAKIDERVKLRNVDLLDDILTRHRENDGAPSAMLQCAIRNDFARRQ